MKKVLLKLMSETFHFKTWVRTQKVFFVLLILGHCRLNYTICLIHGQEICDF